MARKYTRDNRGRFASTGSGATARGGRLKTASGNKRQTQTMQAKGGRAGTIGKPKGLKPGALKPKAAAGSKSPLKRTGQKIAVPTLKTNSERGRQGVVSMSVGAKQARRGAVAERKAEKLARIKERQSEIVARRQGNRLSTYTTSGQFNQSAANLNQAKASRSKRLQQWLTTRDPASRPARSRNAAAKPAPQLAVSKIQKTRSRLGDDDFQSDRKWAKNETAKLDRQKKRLEKELAALKRAQSAALKPAAKAGAKGGRQITAEKALRVSQRINNVTNAASSKTGVKRLNATEVGVRAKAFATRKVGGMSGTVGMNFQQQQAAVRAGLSKPPRYSTQKPNRNKPLRYNSLGQDSARAKAAQAAMTARQKIAQSNAAKPKPQSTVSRTGLRGIGPRALALPPASVPGYVTGRRVAGTIRKPKANAAPSSTVARTRSQAKAAQRFRRNAILDRTRNWNGRNPGIKRSDTGMRQLSLAGPSKTLYSFKRTKLGRKPR